MNWLTGTVHATAVGQVWRTLRFTNDEAAHPGIKAKGEESLLDAFTYIDSLLSDGRDWAVPGQYTIVDPYLLVFYNWGQRMKIDMRGKFPAWSKVMDKVCARPAVRKVLADERVEIR
jgi:glutathione S-transferase